MLRGLWTRSIRPGPQDVGPGATPGDPHGVVVDPDPPARPPLPPIDVQPWSGWPAEWATPNWNGQVAALTDTAWLCVDLNASILASLPPYLVGAADTLNADWLRNPDPDMYSSWDEFAKQLFWEFQLGEVFVLASARYSTGWPARFYVVPGWTVDVDFGRDGRRRYKVGDEDVTADILHLRYTSTVDDTHGHGPLEAGAGRVVAAQMLSRYGAQLASNGGIPSSILRHPEELTADQAMDLQAQWVQARISAIGEPAVLSGGVMWEATQLSPKDMALLELSQWNESRIAVLLGVPPFIVGLPSGGDAMTYSNVTSLFDYHWRAGLRPKAEMVMNGLSAWALPRGTRVELNRDAYIAPEPLVRAQIAATLHAIQDPLGNPAITVDEIRAGMRIDDVVQAEEAAPTTGGILG